MVRRNALFLWVIAAFVLSELLARALGIRFASETLGTLYQYLDPAILRDDLARGLYYLHAQPPLFNLGLGLTLKAFPETFPIAFEILLGVTALALLLSMAWLMRYAGVPEPVAALVSLAFALSPNFVVYRNWLFYTLPVALMLSAGAALLVRFLASGGALSLASFAAVAAALMLTRSTFHPIWLVLAVLAALPFTPAPRRRPLVLACLVSLLVVNLWFLKNSLLVGSYSGSSWLGLSLAKRWPLSQEEVKDLKARAAIPQFWQRRPFQEPKEYRRFGFFEERPSVHPALDAPYKSNGEPNFNHRDYVEIAGTLLRGNLVLIRRFPDRYLERTATALLLYLQPGPNSVHFLVDYDFERVHGYRDLLTRYLFLGGRVERPIRMLDPRPNLLLVLFPLLLGFGVRELARGPARSRALHAFMLVTVVWVTAVSNLVEIGENDRMRWEIEPFLAIWLASVLAAVARRLRLFAGAETA